MGAPFEASIGNDNDRSSMAYGSFKFFSTAVVCQQVNIFCYRYEKEGYPGAQPSQAPLPRPCLQRANVHGRGRTPSATQLGVHHTASYYSEIRFFLHLLSPKSSPTPSTYFVLL